MFERMYLQDVTRSRSELVSEESIQADRVKD